MKESDYILVSNLAHVEIALATTRKLLPVDGVMTQHDIDTMTSYLSRWQMDMFEILNAEKDEGG